MKLIFIYGPPAAGKHTVGHTLSELTGYRFFYNHMTIDVVRVLFEDSYDPERIALLDNLRIEVIEAAARLDINMVFTLAYTKGVSEPFVARMVEVVQRHGGEVHFVQLHPPEETLFERIDSPSRHALAKMASTKELRQVLDNYDMHGTLEFPSTLRLDTSRMTPLESANKIVETFAL